MIDTEHTARDALRRFVLELNPALDPAELRDDTALIACRLITSRHVLDLLLLVESLRHAPIDPRTLVPSAFADINSIVTNLLPACTASERGPQ